MKIGEYIRTPYGKIGKITHIYSHKPYFDDGFILDNEEFIQCGMKAMKELESTPNIIDLIQEGDYIDGFKVIEVRHHLHNDKEIILSNGIHRCSFSKNESDYKIKSIVTKEQFESMEYILKGEDKS